MNERRKVSDVKELEVSKVGYANGLSTQIGELLNKGEHRSLNQEEKDKIISDASYHYGKFLTALGVDWENDPNSMETPTRVSKAYVNDLWRGRYELIDSNTTAFPADNYSGIILERDIPVVSMCSHHHQTILGKCHIAYIPKEIEGTVVGLSKLNRIVEQFARRGAIQEGLTMAIHNAINKVVGENQGVYVIIVATHNCVSCRGVKHMGAAMVTAETSGVFSDHTKTAKQEVLEMLKLPLQTYN
jgi:GTP cyclohydrolase I